MTDYGTDFSTFVRGFDSADMDPLLQPISGPRTVVENVARRLQTPRGLLEDCPEYGIDVRSLLGSSMSDSSMVQLIGQEIEKDERVISASVDVLRMGDAIKLTCNVSLSEGAFPLVLTVDSVTANITAVF